MIISVDEPIISKSTIIVNNVGVKKEKKEMFKLRLKEKREERGMTQCKLAEKVYISQQIIAAYEVGIRKPSLDVLIAIADVLDCTTDYLLGRTN